MGVLKDLAATVVVNGRALIEHDPRDDHPDDGMSTMTRYIEVIAGANFELQFEVKAHSLVNYHGLEFRASINGVVVDNRILRADTTMTLKGARELVKGKWNIRKFRFSNVLLDDGAGSKGPQPGVHDLANLGVITISVYRIASVEESQPTAKYSPAVKDLKSQSLVSEKLLKGRAISHQTSFDKPQKIDPLRILNCVYLDGKDRPFVTFHFKYRSRKALQAELIVPRSPSPVPLEDRPVESLTREEMMELLARRPIPVKPEVQVKEDPTVSAGMKREHDPEFDEILASAHVRKAARKRQQVEVVDLLDD